MILGGGGATKAARMLLDGGALEKPMLGRYEVEKELGKGAMGVVYLGKDPKIGRVVAIKTMALSEEFEADELAEAQGALLPRSRDGGAAEPPEHRHHLRRRRGARPGLHRHGVPARASTSRTTRKHGQLLPLPTRCCRSSRASPMRSATRTAQNVVHRDIKPANIMYDAESDTRQGHRLRHRAHHRLRSKTKTGMVLGTPSYMSPEQLAGKKIDGRSDLFSLGVTLYPDAVRASCRSTASRWRS